MQLRRRVRERHRAVRHGQPAHDIAIGQGDDILDGGDGYDTAVFSGPPSSFGWDGTHLTITGPDGTDTLENIEAVDFGSGPQPLLLVGPGGYPTIQAAMAHNPMVTGAATSKSLASVTTASTAQAASKESVTIRRRTTRTG